MTATPSPPRSISAPELQQRLAADDAVQLVDVREEQELNLARLPHPVLHLPLSRSGDWMDTIENHLERNLPVVVLCHAGVRSWHFACWLIETHGFEQVWNLRGGIDAWSLEVDATVPRY